MHLFFGWGGLIFFFCQPVKYVIHVYAVIGNQTKLPMHKVWWLLERPHKSGKRSYPYVKKIVEFRFWL